MLAILFGILTGSAYATTCGTWDANFTLDVGGEYRSWKLSAEWSEVDDCTGFDLDHYEVCIKKGASAPTSPSDSSASCASADPEIGWAEVFAPRSDATFTGRVFACDNLSCDNIYGDDGTEVASDDEDDGATEPEHWVLVEVSNYSDTDRTIDGDRASASTGFFYPDGWTNEGKLALWWSEDPSGPSDPDSIMFKYANDAGWEAWNTYTNWSSSGVEVAEGIVGSSYFGKTTHPWAVPTFVDPYYRVRLFLQVDNNSTPPMAAISVNSTDQEGADFGLTCGTSPTCSVASPISASCPYNDLCAYPSGALALPSSLTGAVQPSSAAHGRIVWDYMHDGPVEFANDEPSMVTTGSVVTTGGCTSSGGADDILQATWNKTYTRWEYVGMSYSSPPPTGCPTEVVANRHDPGVVPMENGEFKLYVKDGVGTFYVLYGDGSTWSDSTAIEIYFDDGTTAVHPNCLQNVDAVVYSSDPSDPESLWYKGLFFKSAYGTIGGVSCFSVGGIVFADLGD